MKYVTTYCWECGSKQKHKVINYSIKGKKRILLGIITLGISEAFNCRTVECCECGCVSLIV